MTLTNGIVNGLAAYQKDLGNEEYSEGWERIYGEKKTAKVKQKKYTITI